MKTDNRWPVGSLEGKIPEEATAVYSARWIDHGTSMDVVPDRQGFAYDDDDDRDALIRRMEQTDLRQYATTIPRDEALSVVTHGALEDVKFHCWMRRAGGYVYVAAWIA